MKKKLKRHGAEEPQNDALNPRYTMLNDSANFLMLLFVNGLTLCRNPAMLPDAVSGIYPYKTAVSQEREENARRI